MLSRALFILLAGCLALSGRAAPERSPLESGAAFVVLIFVSSECPISNKLAPEMERLHRKFSTNGVLVATVYPNPSDTAEKVAVHRREFLLTAPFIRDAGHKLVKAARVTVTPEAAIFDAKRSLVYRGRVTDQFLALGKGRPQPSRHDLDEAIAALLAGRQPASAHLEAVGCVIQDP